MVRCHCAKHLYLCSSSTLQSTTVAIPDKWTISSIIWWSWYHFVCLVREERYIAHKYSHLHGVVNTEAKRNGFYTQCPPSGLAASVRWWYTVASGWRLTASPNNNNNNNSCFCVLSFTRSLPTQRRLNNLPAPQALGRYWRPFAHVLCTTHILRISPVDYSHFLRHIDFLLIHHCRPLFMAQFFFVHSQTPRL